MSKFLEQLKIYLKVLGLNRKSTIVSFTGLGISLALISVGLIFSFSFQYGALPEYLGAEPTKQLTLSLINFELDDPQETYNELQDIVTKASEDYNFENKIRRIDWFYAKNYFIEFQ